MQQKFAMNKSLKQKPIRPMEELHTKQQFPKAVLWMELWARRSKMAAKWARTRAWAGWKMECVGAGISGRGPRGPTRQAGAPRGVGAPSTLVAWCFPLLQCFQCLKSSNIPKKIILNLQGIWSTLIFGLFFCSTDNSENWHIILFCFIYSK